MGCLRSHRRNLKIVPSHRTTALWTYVIEGVEPASLGLNVSIRYGDTGARSEAHWPDPISALRHQRVADFRPPAKLAPIGTSAKQTDTKCDGKRRFQSVDQRVLSGRDHLTADGKEHQTQTKLRCGRTGTA